MAYNSPESGYNANRKGRPEVTMEDKGDFLVLRIVSGSRGERGMQVSLGHDRIIISNVKRHRNGKVLGVHATQHSYPLPATVDPRTAKGNMKDDMLTLTVKKVEQKRVASVKDLRVLRVEEADSARRNDDHILPAL